MENLQEKKNNSKKWFYIGIGVILVSVLLFLFKEKPEEEVVEEVPLNETNDFGYKVKTFSDANIRAVKIPGKDYYVAETEVTIGQYLKFCKSVNSHYPEWLEKGSVYNIYTGKDDDLKFYENTGMSESNTNHPITGISWHDAVAFAEWVGGRLPTEEEWEHAAKGGQNFIYAGSNNIDEVAYYCLEDNDIRTHPVKGKKPNDYGLYDMSGNVWEWTNSWFDNSQSGRVLRGGSFFHDSENCLLANRDINHPDYDSIYLGFRVLFP